MPIIIYYRFWCNTCKDFTLHHTNGDKCCKICGNITETYKESEIPIEKIQMQRERYKKYESEHNGIGAFFKILAHERPFAFSEIYPNIEIIEDDAGQKRIDEAREQKIKKQLAEIRLEREKRQDIKNKARGLSRNDICFCGSGLKFKKCCLIKIQ